MGRRLQAAPTTQHEVRALLHASVEKLGFKRRAQRRWRRPQKVHPVPAASISKIWFSIAPLPRSGHAVHRCVPRRR